VAGTSVKAVYALFADPDSAQRAVENLRQAGVPDSDITIISSEPFEEYEFSQRDRATWIYWIASAGGAVGLTLGYWLTSMTQRAWPLRTGGMPIVAMWPNLVVIFELTMLFAIVATVATLLVTAKLPRRRPALYDPEVSNGRILVGLEDPRLPLPTIERALAWRSGIGLKTIP
jgi:Alternative complex III, ActD subunit